VTCGAEFQLGDDKMTEAIAWEELPERDAIPGFHGRFLTSERMTFALWRLDRGALLPAHEHPHEQVINVFSGELEITMDGRRHVLGAGMVLVIPPGLRHEGRVLADTAVLDVFAPVREDYREGGTSLLAVAAR
jgi:quercetin dioxygenase-like cupin family protein